MLELRITGSNTADRLADELERITPMIRDGFTSGEVADGGWWSITGDEESEDCEHEFAEDDDGINVCEHCGLEGPLP